MEPLRVNRNAGSFARERICCITLAAAFTIAVPMAATPEIATTTMTLAATVLAGCSSFTSSALNFGSIPSEATAESIATVSVTCGNSVQYEIASNGGSNHVCFAGVYYYQMGSSAAPRYQLYIDAARSLELAHPALGPCSTGISVSGTGSGSVQTFSLYAVAVGSDVTGRSVAAGDYSDVVTLTLTF